jgi:hypothetical protein
MDWYEWFDQVYLPFRSSSKLYLYHLHVLYRVILYNGLWLDIFPCCGEETLTEACSRAVQLSYRYRSW